MTTIPPVLLLLLLVLEGTETFSSSPEGIK
jgi:hypothetical protein